MVIIIIVVAVNGVPKSEFNRKIDYDKMEEDYSEEESREWHEDTWEWQGRRNYEKYWKMDFAKPATLDKDIMLMKAQKDPAKIRVIQVYLEDGTCESEEVCRRMAKGWQGLILSGGQTSVHVESPKRDRFEVQMHDGSFSAAKDFVLTLPHVRKIFWNNYLIYPDTDLGRAEKAKDGQKGTRFKSMHKRAPEF